MHKINDAVIRLIAAIEEETGEKNGLTRLCFSHEVYNQYLINRAQEYSFMPSDVNCSHICGVKLDARDRVVYE